MKKILTYTFLLCLLSGTAQAKVVTEKDLQDCGAQFNCVKKTAFHARERMEKVFKAILMTYNPKKQAELKSAHKDFIKYRQKFCAIYSLQGSTPSPVMAERCEAQLNVQYTRMLDDILINIHS